MRTHIAKGPIRPAVLAIINAPSHNARTAQLPPHTTTLDGLPLLAWPIAAALAATSVHRSIVITDNQPVADTAERLGCPAIVTNQPIPDNHAALTHATRNTDTTPFSAAVILSPAAPFRQRNLIDHTADTLVNTPDANSAVAAHNNTDRPHTIEAHTLPTAPTAQAPDAIRIPIAAICAATVTDRSELTNAHSHLNTHADRIHIVSPRSLAEITHFKETPNAA